MGRNTKHLKRMPAPKTWPISRKRLKWIVKPTPGPHAIKHSFPLLLVIRDMLAIANTRKEARIILSEENIKVDGKIRRKDDYPIGLMDVIEIPKINKAFRLLPVPKKGLILHPINGEEKEYKLCKILNKNIVKKGYLQLNLHDGKNILIKTTDPIEAVYSTSDLLKIKIPHLEILEHLTFGEDVLALLIGGKNSGRFGKIVKIMREKGSFLTTVTLVDDENTQFKTILDYVFPIGKDEPWISLPEG
jgi:small subunit ribosomal protein S4e